MSAPKKNPERWLELYPELATRPNLVTAMLRYPRIRARFFEVAASLESIALLTCSRTAGLCLHLFWNRTKKDLYNYWHDKLRRRTGTDQLFNELYGAIRNIFYNIHLKAGCKPPARHIGGENDVVRQYRDYPL
jgi:hypothetical protein